VSCTPCLANAQVLAAGTFDDDQEILALLREQDFGGAVEVFHNGAGLCLRHFNLARHWPKNYPDEPLPEHLRNELFSRYEAILDDETHEADDDSR